MPSILPTASPRVSWRNPTNLTTTGKPLTPRTPPSPAAHGLPPCRSSPRPAVFLTGRDPHPHRQLKCPRRSDRRINRRARRRERGSHAVTAVAEQKTVVRLNRGTQHLVMRPPRPR